MLILLHALILCFVAYILPYILHLDSLPFGTVIPTPLNILMEMLLLPCFTFFFVVYSLANTMLIALVRAPPRPFCCSWSCETQVGNNEEMLVYRSFTCPGMVLQGFVGERHCAQE